MAIVHKAGNIHMNDDGLSRLVLCNTPDNPAYVPENSEPQIPIEGSNMKNVEMEFFEEAEESYKQDTNFHIPTSLLKKDCEGTALDHYLDDIWKTSYDN
ncbi:hypothetical protein O181_031917 [Austropuccinia psidii MF-1]|uniref:Uncharacterized protein n=1 Tax=Austropuccinia psidii MF-1 TaxID=1389203 RepID=A0A9Q3CYI5_9BASI|nr:hypothetical protein [Austropuccinia psidii MF-1]